MTAGLLSSADIGAPPIVSSVGRYSAFATELATQNAGAAASAAWTLAKRVIYVPIYLPVQVTVKLVWWLNGATASTDNIQCGVYASSGGLPTTLLIANGTTTLSAGANVVQSVDVADTILGPGSYFLALTSSGTTATIARIGLQLIAFGKVSGMCGETTGTFGLTTATPVTLPAGTLPIFGFSTVTTI